MRVVPSLSRSPTSDPGDETFSLDSQTCGTEGVLDGAVTFIPADGSGSFTCDFPDGDASSDVSVQVSDGDTVSDADTITVTIENVDPIVTLTGNSTVDEGGSIAFTFTTSDPGDETFSLDSQTCGTEGVLDGAVTFIPADGSGSFTCDFPDGDSSSDVSVQVSDGDTVSDADTITVTIENVDPTVTLTGNSTVDEGGSIAFTFTTSDPGDETFSLDSQTCGTEGVLDGTVTFIPADGSGKLHLRFPRWRQLL